MIDNMRLHEKQTERLFDLLCLKFKNKGLTVNGLDCMIAKAKCSMTQESVAWVEKLIAEIYPQ